MLLSGGRITMVGPPATEAGSFAFFSGLGRLTTVVTGGAGGWYAGCLGQSSDVRVWPNSPHVPHLGPLEAQVNCTVRAPSFSLTISSPQLRGRTGGGGLTGPPLQLLFAALLWAPELSACKEPDTQQKREAP